MFQSRKRLTAIAAALAVGSTCVATIAVASTPHTLTAADESATSFIVSFDAPAVPGTARVASDRLTDFVDSVNGFARRGDVTIKADRTLATGGGVVSTSEPLEQSQLDKLITTMKDQPGVVDVRIDAMRQAYALPSDPMVDDQWYLDFPIGGMRMEQAFGITRGDGINVAVIDSGIVSHADLDANVIAGYDMISEEWIARDDDGRDSNPRDEGTWHEDGECGGSLARDSSWHGTHVAGTIGAVADNGRGVTGIAPEANIIPIRSLGKCGGKNSDVVDSIMWAAGAEVPGTTRNENPAHVINMSLGGEEACSVEEQRAIDYAIAQGANVVVAAGNSNDDVANYSPANCDGVITVAANDKHGNRTYYSNYGSLIDIAAPGGESEPAGDEIFNTVNTGTTVPRSDSYGPMSGTSMASPAVAGAVALMRATGAPAGDVAELIKDTARPLPGDCEGGCGAGIIDVSAAIRKLTGAGDYHSGTEVVTNGGFENGDEGWTIKGRDVITTSRPATGSYAASLVGRKYPETETISQRVSIPSGVERATLRFDLWVDSEETLEGRYNDTLKVTLGDEEILLAGDLDAGSRYVEVTQDVTRFAGRTLDLTFTGKEDSFRKTEFLVDNVSLKAARDVNDPTPTPTPTPPPTPTPTSTPTPTPENEFEDITTRSIRDYATVRSSIESTYVGADEVTLWIDARHTCEEDLSIWLTTPDDVRNSVKGSSWSYNCTVWDGTKSDSYPLRSPSDGAWELEVTDNYRGDTGTLRGWGIALS